MRKKSVFTLAVVALAGLSAMAQKPSDTPASQMEKLDRGLVVVPTTSGKVFVSWRLLGTDNDATHFEVLKNGQLASDVIYKTTSLTMNGTKEDEFQVVTLQDGVRRDTTAVVKPWASSFLQLKLDRPADGKTKPYTVKIDNVTYSYPNGQDYSYSPNDMSVGDVDGDGQYELFVKWDPSNSKDNSQGGVTGNVYIDCYKLDGTKLWRIDLGRNIRAGAHYTQFLVYDFDGDGRAELMCKTGPGSMDAAGRYVNKAATESAIQNADNTKDWTSSEGRVTGGQEYLTVFSGLTGEAIHTVYYNPNRNQTYGGAADGSFNWGAPDNKNDAASYGNRGERFLAAVAYLDGPDQRPSGIFSRGYYGYAFVWAVDFDGQQIHQKWLHASTSKTQYSLTTYDANGTGTKKSFTPGKCSSGEGRNTMFANGNHNLSVGDVDGDGKDEIIWGAAALDHDGMLLYSVGFGHGDAIHLADLDPDRPGLELFDIHEDKGTYAWDLHDAATGEIIWKGGVSGVDNGRGLAADIVSSSRGYEFWSSEGGFSTTSRDRNPYNVITGKKVGTSAPSQNFRIYWDGDQYDELLDNVTISKYGGSSLGVYSGRGSTVLGGSPSSCNSTKATPCLSADIFGDWREEVILWSTTDNATINIYSSAHETNYRVPTLMHDHVYRMGVAWQNVGYNQPPHLGYYLPDYIDSFQGKDPTGIHTVKAEGAEAPEAWYDLQGRRISQPTKAGIYIQNGKKLLVK